MPAYRLPPESRLPDTDVPADRPLPAARSAAIQDLLEEAVRSSAKPRPWWKKRAVIIGAIGAVAAGTAAATTSHYVFAPRNDPLHAERCYFTAHLDDNYMMIAQPQHAWNGVGTAAPSYPPEPDERTQQGAIDACAFVYRSGVGKDEHFPTNSAGMILETHPLPQVVACELSGGMPAVFPGDQQTCERLGLKRLPD